jgi:putative hemolysin
LSSEPSLEIAFQVDLTFLFGLIGIVILLFCFAIVSVATVAFFSLSQKDLDDSILENNSKRKIIACLLEKPIKFFATLLVTNNFINTQWL